MSSRSRVLGPVLLFAGLLAACGGRSFPGSQEDDGPVFTDVLSGSAAGPGVGAGGSGVGGSGAGGKASAGTSGSATGGTGSGGKTGTAGSTGTAGKTGAAGDPFGGGPGGSTGTAGKGTGASPGTGGASTGGGPGTGAGPGTGGSSTISACTSCAAKTYKTDLCVGAQAKCEQVKGCNAYVECALKNDCLGKSNPGQCFEQSGCKGNQQTKNAARQVISCLICEGCQDTCNSDACPPGTGGSTGTGGSSGSLEEQCAACQQTTFNACQTEYFDCTNDTDCGLLLQCFQGCAPDDDQCYTDCWDNNLKGQQKYYALFQCYNCKQCGEVCGPLNPGLCN